MQTNMKKHIGWFKRNSGFASSVSKPNKQQEARTTHHQLHEETCNRDRLFVAVRNIYLYDLIKPLNYSPSSEGSLRFANKCRSERGGFLLNLWSAQVPENRQGHPLWGSGVRTGAYASG
jgi:hypothetical protein